MNPAPPLTARFPALVRVLAAVFLLAGMSVSVAAGETIPAKLGAAAFDDKPIVELLGHLSGETGVAINSFGSVAGADVSIEIEEGESLGTFVKRLCETYAWVWFRDGDGNIGLSDEIWYRQNLLPGGRPLIKIYRLEHLEASDAAAAIHPFLTPGESHLTADDRTNKLIVSDTIEILKAIGAHLDQIDVPAAPLAQLHFQLETPARTENRSCTSSERQRATG